MDRLLYIGMSGAKEAMMSQAVDSQNLANSNTTGFRADLDAYTHVSVVGPVYDSRAYAIDEDLATDFTPGPLQTTGRSLDVAVDGEGFIAVQAPDGGEAYTRRGDLRVDAFGQLQTGDGRDVMGNNGPIFLPPAEHIEIGGDGTISVTPQGAAPGELAVVDRIKLVNPDLANLEKTEAGLIRAQDGAPVPADAAVGLVSGSLEGSNVNPVESMVSMIDNARRFEMNTKVFKLAEENDQASTRLLSRQ